MHGGVTGEAGDRPPMSIMMGRAAQGPASRCYHAPDQVAAGPDDRLAALIFERSLP